MDGTSFSRSSNQAAGNRGLILLTLCLAILVAQIDTAVVNLAVRPIGDYFHAGVGALQWVVDSYNLVYAVLLLTGGLLADLYGRRLVFMAGAAIFTLASLGCAFAPSVSFLIATRAVTGVGAALLIPASLAIIRVVWLDAAERGRALGIWAACNGLAMAIGPTLGGFLIVHAGWRSIFLVVVPVSAAALLLAPLVIAETADSRGRSFDAFAQILGACGLGCLAFGAIEFHAAPITAFAAMFLAFIAAVLFVKVEAKKGNAALVPLEIFRIPAFLGAIIATGGMTFSMYGALFLLPLTWQSTGRLDALEAGLALMAMALVFLLVSPFSGGLAKTYGGRRLSIGGVTVIGAGLIVIAVSAGQASLVATEIGLGLTGLGMGLATGPLLGAAVGAVGPARSGTAAALVNVVRMSGATIGVAGLGAVFSLAQGGAEGLRDAMLIGGLIQLACAGLAWRLTRSGEG
jgi:DHA2 family methylenomycin A resistance protein-like MFS transporter